MVRLRQDPVAEVLEVVNRLYPDLDIVIDFYECEVKRGGRGKGFGACQFLPGGKIEIGLNLVTPYMAVPEILAHEIAHAVVGPDVKRPHGKAWNEVFSRIHEAHCALVAERFPDANTVGG